MNTVLNEWAQAWGVPYAALEDLRQRMGMATDPETAPTGRSEAAAQQAERLHASRQGGRLWRNNVGAYYDDDGRFIRYGLVNESAALNKRIKSSDLIGCYPVVIEPGHVGHTLGLFVAREVKPPGWVYSGQGREPAQLAFLNLVNSLGGDGRFTTGEGLL